MRIADASDVMPKNLLKKELLILQLCGLSLNGNESTAYKIYSLIVLSLTYTYPFVQLIGVVLKPAEIDFETVYCLFGIYLVLAKMTVLLRGRSKIRKTLIKLGKEPFTVNLERGGVEEEKLFNECVHITATQTLVYVTSITVHIFGPAAFTFLMRLRSNDYHDWKLPFGQLSMFNRTISPSFEIAWAYQVLSVSLICFTLSGIDLITYFVLCFISYQFKFLQNCVRRMVNHTYKEVLQHHSYPTTSIKNNSISWKSLRLSLEETVRYHLEIIGIASEMENVFSLLFLVILLNTIVILCFMIYRLSTVTITDPEAMTFIVEIVFYCLQVALLCFWGEQATFDSQEVAQGVYEADFVGTDLRFQKGLMLIIRRSQRATKITAGKFTDIRLSTFVWVYQLIQKILAKASLIMRASYSSFMLLRNMNRG